MLRKTMLILIVALLSISMVLAGCSQGGTNTTPGNETGQTGTNTGGTSTPSGPKKGGEITYALARDIVALEPQVSHGATTSDFQANIYDTLVEWDNDGNLVGSLAESWDIPDAQTYIFHLRKGVKFQDGGDFNAADVKFSLERILNPDTGASRRPQLMAIDKIEVVDDYTVKITMKQPYAVFLAILTLPDVVMLDKEWVEAGHDPNKEANGTGPFMLESAEPEVQYVLVRNPNYWREGQPYLDKITENVIADDKARLNAVYAGEADFTHYVPWTELDTIKNNDNLTLYLGYDLYNLLRMNPQRAPFDDVRVRKGMNYLINRQELIDLAWGGYGQPITGGLAKEGEWWFCPELEGTYTYDPDKADQLFKEAGIDDPSKVDMNIYSITMTVHWDTSQVVVNELKNYGFNATMEPQEVAALNERRVSGDYQLMQDGLSESYPDPDWFSVYFKSTGNSYATGTGFKVDKIDSLFDQGLQKTTIEDRKPIYCELQKAVLDEAPWVFQLWRPQAEVGINALKGYVRVPGVGMNSTRYAERWWLDQ